ncbi:hypothetical protein OMD46_16535 [Pseudomonas sp. MDMC_285]|nr:hypothetical protein [Pseudomonas sp. MDMC_285]
MRLRGIHGSGDDVGLRAYLYCGKVIAEINTKALEASLVRVQVPLMQTEKRGRLWHCAARLDSLNDLFVCRFARCHVKPPLLAEMP